MSAESLNLKISGLFTSYNDLSEVPQGALIVADNIDLIQNSIAQPRRGFQQSVFAYASGTDRTDALTTYINNGTSYLFSHHGTLGSANILSYESGGSWTTVGSYSAISGLRMRFKGFNKNLYFNTKAGVYRLDAYNGTPRLAGAYKALDVTTAVSASSSTWLANNMATAYRVVWGYKDANSNLVLGAPSAWTEFVNSSGSTKAVDITTTIPTGVTTDWFVQLYRAVSVSSSVSPSDEMGLVYEYNPNSTDISNKYITITDIVPDSLIGATLYTSASQSGLAMQNEQPPLCEDMTLFRNSMFYMNTTSKHRFYLTLISVGSPNGIVVDDTVTIDGVTYTAKSSETVTSGQFKVSTGGSISQNITNTAQSLVRVINQYSSSTVYAYYISGPNDLPGMILLEERGIGGVAFSIRTSRSTCWNPSSIPAGGNTVTSTNDQFLNGVYYTNPNEEAAPLPNFMFVGSRNDKILRGIALRDGLYIFKESGEVWKISGYYPNFQVDKIEDSVKLISRESCQVLNNEIYCLADQGIAVVTDSTRIISRPIEQDLLSLVNQNYSLVQSIAFGLSYESDRKYYIFLPSSSSDTYPTQAYVYNIFTNSWVRHTISATTGIVDLSNNLYFGDGTSNYLLQERKNYSFLDYVDFGFTTTITSISGTSVKINSGFDTLAVGDVLYQSNTDFTVISALNPATQTITIESDPGLTLASVSVLKAIQTKITWAPVSLANAGIQKQLHTATLIFKQDFNGTGYIGFTSDLSQFEEKVPLTGRGLGLWGLFAWGNEPWGGSALRRPVRQWVPRAKQRSSQLIVSWSHAWGYSNWQITGLALFGEQGSENIGRS